MYQVMCQDIMKQYLDNVPVRRKKTEKTALQQIDANFMSGKEDGEHHCGVVHSYLLS